MDDILILRDKDGGTAILTTASPASHYGIPVLRIEADDIEGDFGPGDLLGVLPNIFPAANIVAAWGRAPERTDEERKVAALYLRQWPEGPQVEPPAAILGRKGRAVNSPAQQAASRASGAKGGRPTYSAAAAREIERENRRFATLPAAASGEGMARYAEEHVRIIEGIVAKYGCRREVTKVLANGIKCVTIYDKDGAIVAEHHE